MWLPKKQKNETSATKSKWEIEKDVNCFSVLQTCIVLLYGLLFC